MYLWLIAREYLMLSRIEIPLNLKMLGRDILRESTCYTGNRPIAIFILVSLFNFKYTFGYSLLL
jgi:hypothetical protein